MRVLLILSIFLICAQKPGASTFFRNESFVQSKVLPDIFSTQIKPILDKRCVVCHSCSEAPCQLKLESIEGLVRGSKRSSVRGGLITRREGNRLLYDAETLEEWRNKGFYSVIDPILDNNSVEAPIMLQSIINGRYPSLSPIKGMPFGLANLDFKNEYSPLVTWLSSGANVPSDNEQTNYPETVKKWESFFNAKSSKAKWSSRYLYEHLFEAHFYIKEAPGEFFQIVRSATSAPEKIKAISSDHETDDPRRIFYYRLRKINSTIVFKNHILYEVSDRHLKELKNLFWETSWEEEKNLPPLNYDNTNPFFAFRMIPAKVRYQWMLQNAEMLMKVIMSGPNCRINNAGSMIWDNYLAIFLKPESDATVVFNDFFDKAAKLLSLPNFTPGTNRYLSQYNSEQIQYSRIKRSYQNVLKPNGLSKKDIWTGNGRDKNSLISIFRHIDYASAHAGHLVDNPRSIHLFDYATFERLYYLCVVATTTRDSAISQVPVVRYLFDLKKELDEHFLSFIPYEGREALRKRLVDGKGTQYDYWVDFALPYDESNKLVVTSRTFKEIASEFLGSVFPKNILGEKSLMVSGKRVKEFSRLFNLNSTPQGTASHFPEISYIKVIKKNASPRYFTLLVNRYHSFLNRLLTDSESWRPEQDQFQVLEDIQVDFPNKIFIVFEEDVDNFVLDVLSVKGRQGYLDFDKKYALQRRDADFWKNIDELHEHFHRSFPLSSGIIDLHKYGRFDERAPSYK